MFSFSSEGHKRSDPQDLRSFDFSFQKDNECRPIKSFRSKKKVLALPPLPCQTWSERLFLDIIKVRTLLVEFRSRRALNNNFKSCGLLPRGDPIKRETRLSGLPLSSIKIVKKNIEVENFIAFLSRHMRRQISFSKKFIFHGDHEEIPLPPQTSQEIIELNRSEEQRNVDDVILFASAWSFWSKHGDIKNDNRRGFEKRKDRRKKKKMNVEEEPQKVIERLRLNLADLEIDYKLKKKDDFIKKSKKNLLCRIHPQEIEAISTVLNKITESKNKRFLMKQTVLVPSFISELKILSSRWIKLAQLQDLLSFYNLSYCVYWTCRAYKIYLTKRYFKRLYELYREEKSIKSLLCSPFEEFLNHELEGYFEYKKIKKELKRNPDSENIKKKKNKIFKNLKKKNLQSLGLCKGLDALDSLETFVSFLFSLYMGKKCIFVGTSDVSSCFEKHKKLMSREPEIDSTFKKFVIEETSRLFRDFSYRSNSKHCAPPTSYCLKGKDLNLHNYLLENDGSRSHFQNFWGRDELDGLCKEIYEDFLADRATHQVKAIREKGKTRIITTNHPATFLMKDFQWNIHNHLRKNPIFFYIGAQVRNRVIIKQRAKDEWVLSGDYENSTDFIPAEMTRAIYDTILGSIRGRFNLKRLVRHSLEDEVLCYPDGDEIVMKSGQLMGGLLSFPALCIMNHCISKFLGINKKKINGDDLLALTRPNCRKEWIERSEALGMFPNDSKSHFHPKYGTFNSQLIALKGGKLYHVPHFSITKLFGASLGDIMNINSKVHQKDYYSFAEVWMENHTCCDLFTGSHLTDIERQKLSKYDSFFFYHYNVIRQRIGGFIGAVGEFSRFYDPDNLDLMIEKNWETKFTGETFAVGNGVIKSLRDLWYYGKKDEFNYLLKNLAGTGLPNLENLSITDGSASTNEQERHWDEPPAFSSIS